MIRRGFLAVIAAGFLWSGAASAEISQPSEIPSYFSGRSDLISQRSALMTRWEAIQQKINDQNSKCSQVAADSPLVDSCRSSQSAILSEIQAYKSDLERYEAALSVPNENLLLIRERNLRDLESAKELRGKAMLQKSRLQKIIDDARQGIQPPDLDKETFDKILAGAPAGIESAEQTLIKTESDIKNLEMKLGWTERAIKNLDDALKSNKEYDPKEDLGFGMVLQPATANVRVFRPGRDGSVPLGEGLFLPGDEIVTDKLGQTRLSSLGSSNYVVAVGPQTRLKLEQDHKVNGTIWGLNQGVVHYAPLGGQGTGVTPAPFKTPDSIVQGSPDSEFDVRINEKGETSVEVYQGKVEVREPAKGTSYFVDSKTDKAETAPWWNKNE